LPSPETTRDTCRTDVFGLVYDGLVTERPVTRLDDLPAFQVLQITNADDPELIGVFTHLKSVRTGRSWLYAGDADSLIGDLVDLDEATRHARFTAPFWSPTSPIQVGSVVPWLDGYWQAYHLTMILDQQAAWKRTEFTPSPAQHFRQGDVHGWTKAGHKLPDDAVPTSVDELGWDHEHCELCQSRIGRGGAHHGYVDRNDRWLCEPCYQHYAEPRSLGFVFSI
jgi:hypothetical protein